MPTPRPVPARVVVADDHPLYRAGVVRALRSSGRFAIAGEAADGQTAYRQILAEQPELAILDVRMPQLDGLSVLARLRTERVRVPVLMLSAFTEPEVVEHALAHGAVAFVDKQADRDALVAAAVAVVTGRPAGSRSSAEPGGPLLLPLERSILAMLRDGWALHDLPALLGEERATVERYALDATARLGAGRALRGGRRGARLRPAWPTGARPPPDHPISGWDAARAAGRSIVSMDQHQRLPTERDSHGATPSTARPTRSAAPSATWATTSAGSSARWRPSPSGAAP